MRSGRRGADRAGTAGRRPRFLPDECARKPGTSPGHGVEEVAAALIGHPGQVFRIHVQVSGFICLEGALFRRGFPSLRVAQVPWAFAIVLEPMAHRRHPAAGSDRGRSARHSGSGTPAPRPEDRRATQAASCAGPLPWPPRPGSSSSAIAATCGCGRPRCRVCTLCRPSAASPRSVLQDRSPPDRGSECPPELSGSSSFACEDGSAWTRPVPCPEGPSDPILP